MTLGNPRTTDSPAIFPAGCNPTPVSEIKPPAPDPRAERVHRIHGEIARQVRTGEIYRRPRKLR